MKITRQVAEETDFLRKQMSGAERRQWVDRLLEQYAPLVWNSVATRYDSETEAEDAFVYIFTLIILKLNRHTIETLSEDWIRAMIDEGLQTTPPSLPPLEQEFKDEELHGQDGESGSCENPIPLHLNRRAQQMMRAQIAMQEALRHHKGPLWSKIGATVAVLVGIVGVGYGVSDRVYAHFHHTEPVEASSEQGNTGHVVGELSATPVGLYQLPSLSTVDLNHVSVGQNALFVSRLAQSVDSWPRIDSDEHPFATADKPLGTPSNSFSMELVPPMQRSAKQGAKGWQISSWRVEPMDHWLIGIVSWTDGSKGHGVEQIYALNTDNGKYSLVQTLTPEAGVSNQFVVAVGDGRVIVQSGLDDGTGAPPLGLPILVYALNGSDPLHAWTQSGQIPASFGLMQTPIATADGIVFQGIVGKDETSAANTATWYELSWNGQLSHLYGPPVDGQSHWAVRGSTGTLWWVETTPDASQNHSGLQVSMAELGANKPSTAAKNLDTSVDGFAVDGSYMMWIVPDGHQYRMVVAQAE
ncbi:hypothetical protein [Alicyclobacillus dauci]|uniref:DNA-directed RNA polymerase specialized sigma subunit, sigma24 family n=1 Tax=Alicyclobacillus dauci TaxID=1475485 RepID=A0ABY6Z9T2_9BACL|nr:hypothetical protein [Alicyclobacillus dauci]WAH38921.1 hypothetical protein NZD86_10795 [Alicyclobacillus dauci]